MASVTASSFASTSQFNHGVNTGSQSRAALTKIGCSMEQIMPHTGLRPLNKVDKLHISNTARIQTRKVKKILSKNTNGSSIIVCGSGMNLIFVGTEVAPWSKTGGLGDVLGGLPPAMAVSFLFLPRTFETHQ